MKSKLIIIALFFIALSKSLYFQNQIDTITASTLNEQILLVLKITIMTKTEFLDKVPDIIDHKPWGYGELEILADTKNQKGVCYRHKDKSASWATYGSTWIEVYDDLSKYLISNGYLEK